MHRCYSMVTRCTVQQSGYRARVDCPSPMLVSRRLYHQLPSSTLDCLCCCLPVGPRTPLHLACWAGKVGMIRLLLDNRCGATLCAL